MEQETKLPEGLELAQLCCAHASFTGVPDADARTAHDAIRAEHTQRLTLQHHAADMAQRVADLEAACDKLRHEHHTVRSDAQARVDAAVIRALAAEKERDELRARLAELERQEPVGYMLRSSRDYNQPEVVRDIRDLSASTAENVMCGRNHLDPIYARPAPAIPTGWKLVPVDPTLEMLDSGRKRMSALGIYAAMIAAAPEHKA